MSLEKVMTISSAVVAVALGVFDKMTPLSAIVALIASVLILVRLVKNWEYRSWSIERQHDEHSKKIIRSYRRGHGILQTGLVVLFVMSCSTGIIVKSGPGYASSAAESQLRSEVGHSPKNAFVTAYTDIGGKARVSAASKDGVFVGVALDSNIRWEPFRQVAEEVCVEGQAVALSVIGGLLLLATALLFVLTLTEPLAGRHVQ